MSTTAVECDPSRKVEDLERELGEANRRERATAEILRVISRSHTDVQPVFDTIVRSAVRLCDGFFSGLYRFDGELLHHVADHNFTREALEEVQRRFPARPIRAMGTGRAILERAVVHIPDVEADPEFQLQALTRAIGMRSGLFVPMLREGAPLGVIMVSRAEPGPFSDNQIELLKTFADQAVIAIENTQLFEAEQARTRELAEALERQTAMGEILRVISQTQTDIQPVFDTIVRSAVRLCDGLYSFVARFDGELLHVAAHHNYTPSGLQALQQMYPMRPSHQSATGRAILTRAVVHVEDALADPEYPAHFARAGGWRGMLAVPMLREGSAIGAILVMREQPGPFSETQIILLKTFSEQAVIAIENVRLFAEVQARTRELSKTVEDLEIASQHKSQFVANMSHELRTPLAAILGYAELIQEGFYEPQGPKSLDALTRIRSNGKHLLGLINTVLDIAKIESGQFTLNMTEYAIESVVETVRSATESLAQNKKLALKTEVAKSLPVGLGDEQRLTQVLLNLVGNAIKFTDSGEVCVTARAVNGHFNVSVTDTGPGIPVEHQARIFDQFHQVDSSNTKAKGGTGLGLAIAKQILEMHGGRIWVESTLGKGSTFQMELPTRAEFRKTGS
jgi:signal transduction histidine kinase